MKKRILSILALTLCIPSIMNVFAIEFEGKEDYYTDLCKNTENLTKEDITTCQQFTTYLKDKNSQIENEISKTEEKLSSTLENMEVAKKELQKTEELMTSVKQEIQILEAKIIETGDKIVKKEMQLSDRMYLLQSYVNGNEYLYLLLKSDSIDQLLTRIQNIDELTQYDQDLIKSLAEMKKQLEIDIEAANLRYNDLFALQTQQNTLLLSLGQEAANYSTSLDEIRDTLAGTRVDIGFIDDSLSEAEKRIQAEEERKKAEEEAKRQEEQQKQEENKKPEDNNQPSDDNSTSNDNSSNDNDNSSNNNTSSSSDSSIGNSIVATAKTKVGYPYVYGGTGPNSFDCSGFAQWVYRQNGIYIPRTVTSQYYACELVSNPQPGDLLFFNTTGYLGHVGIYIGGDLFIHAGTSSTGVCYGNLTYAYWQNCYQGAGRFR